MSTENRGPFGPDALDKTPLEIILEIRDLVYNFPPQMKFERFAYLVSKKEYGELKNHFRAPSFVDTADRLVAMRVYGVLILEKT